MVKSQLDSSCSQKLGQKKYGHHTNSTLQTQLNCQLLKILFVARAQEQNELLRALTSVSLECDKERDNSSVSI